MSYRRTLLPFVALFLYCIHKTTPTMYNTPIHFFRISLPSDNSVRKP